MIYDIFYVSRNAINEADWLSFNNRFPSSQKIENVKTFLDISKKSFTKLFWVVWNDLTILEDFNFSYIVPKWDEQYIHVFKNGNLFDGITIFSKLLDVSQKEFDYRFFVNKKEVDIQASIPKPYDKFYIDTYEDYIKASESSTTDLFWFIPKEVEILDTFDIDNFYTHERYNNHVFKNIFRNEETYTGISLISKFKKLSTKEITHRFLVEKKQHTVVASKLKSYDIVFISYNEPTADENYRKLLERFPRAKRIHGVKGIHQAHIEAAKLVDTCMLWVVDGDAEIVDDFNFDHEVSTYEKDIVHVWRSKNPINDLVYGYGGVKLLPTDLTLNMDTFKPDMTTSISNKFKAVKTVSNITAFNTDPFNTWKSAFRECCKLSSKIIDRQKDEETLHRLDIWCTVGIGRPFGDVAIAGAKAGSEYGSANQGNLEALKKINDFDWLQRKFDE